MSTDAFKLPTDQYYIRNEESFSGLKIIVDDSEPSSEGKVPVGRPVKVYCPTVQQLASNFYSMAATHSDLFNLPQWKLVALPNGRYKLFIDGAPTFEQDKHLFASHSINPESGEEWVITKRNSYDHRNQYT